MILFSSNVHICLRNCILPKRATTATQNLRSVTFSFFSFLELKEVFHFILEGVNFRICVIGMKTELQIFPLFLRDCKICMREPTLATIGSELYNTQASAIPGNRE